MPLHNYQCADGHMTEGVYSPASKVLKTVKCACGKRAKQHWGHYKEGLGHTWAISSKGYQKGVDPQTGVEYKHYADRQRTLREQGLEEAGAPKTIEQINEQEYERVQAETAAHNSFERQPVLQAETLDELAGVIGKDMQERQVLKTEHGLRGFSEDGWVSF
jgi:hypothetical protein